MRRSGTCRSSGTLSRARRPRPDDSEKWSVIVMRNRAMGSKRWAMAMATLAAACSLWCGTAVAQTPPANGTPAVGGRAADFTLRALDGTTVQLSKELAKGEPIVLVVLRGWPGYQCPFCTRQFGDYLANATRFDKVGLACSSSTRGPGEGLREHAEALSPRPGNAQGLSSPARSRLCLYERIWAALECAAGDGLPVDVRGRRDGRDVLPQTSRGHGDRVTADAVLKVIARMTQPPRGR